MQRYQEVLLHLSLIKNVGPALVEKILAQVSREKLFIIYSYLISDFMACGISESQALKIFNGLKNIQILEQELKLIRDHKVSLLTVLDDEYPYLLKNITQPPTVLYFWGRPLSDTNIYISVIGSRKAATYAESVADRLIPSFVANGWIVVSGGAKGADTIAHQKTVELGGQTIAILGSGLLRPYPAQNRKLFESILKNNGTIMTPFPMLMEPLPTNFPARNRVIAGLSKGTVVLQAARKSGALITATFALEQGREVFAVPGIVGNELSEGVHDLIKQGACLTTSVEDVFTAFEFIAPKKPVFQELVEIKQIENASVRSASLIKKEEVNLSLIKNQVDERFKPFIKICKQPRSIDEISDMVKMNLKEVYDVLFDMQLEGFIEQNHAGLWKSL